MLVITAFVFSDLIDGAMARRIGSHSKFGAFFDSTLDRIGDGAIFGGLVLYFAGPGDNYLYLVPLAVLPGDGRGDVLRAGQGRVARHATPRAALAERADRLVAILVPTGLGGLFDLPILLEVALWVLAAGQHR